MAYSDKVLDHYENPRNVGSFAKDDDTVGTGMVGAPACGDVMKLQIRVGADGVIEDAKFKTYGCGSAIASSSLVTEWVKGKTLDQALTIKNTQIAEELALPPVKIHCSILAEDAIKAAVADYKQRHGAAVAGSGKQHASEAARGVMEADGAARSAVRHERYSMQARPQHATASWRRHGGRAAARTRNAMAITLTEKAAQHVQKYLTRRGKGVGLRLGVRTTGCSGLAYKLEYVDELAPEDQVFECNGREDHCRSEEPRLYRRHRTRLRARRAERRLQVQQPEREGRVRLRRVVPRLTSGSPRAADKRRRVPPFSFDSRPSFATL